MAGFDMFIFLQKILKIRVHLRPMSFRGERQNQRPSARDVRCTDLLAENCFRIFFPALESARERQVRLN